jgi:hypothetical protein
MEYGMEAALKHQMPPRIIGRPNKMREGDPY